MLLGVFSSRFGVTDRVFEWFQSYLTGRIKSSAPALTTLRLRRLLTVLHVAGSLLFITYSEDLEDAINRFTLNHHMYANDTQVLAHISLKDVQYVRLGLERFILVIQDWCSSGRLQLNPDKTR